MARPKRDAGNTGNGSPFLTGPLRRRRPFHDGAGLCSAGRWPPECRVADPTPLAALLRKDLLSLLRGSVDVSKVIAQLACGRCETSPFSPALVEAGRNIWSSHVRTFALQQGWLDPALALLDTTPDQPYLLHCIGAHLRAIGDPD